MLEGGGFTVIEADRAITGLLSLFERRPDAVLMSEELPPFGAEELLPLFRRLGETPLIVLGTGDEGEEIEMLDAGADDYVRWPSNRPLLVARVSAAIRRYQSAVKPAQILRFDDLHGSTTARAGSG